MARAMTNGEFGEWLMFEAVRNEEGWAEEMLDMFMGGLDDEAIACSEWEDLPVVPGSFIPPQWSLITSRHPRDKSQR